MRSCNEGEKFLLDLYKDKLKNSVEVRHRTNSNDAINNIKRYMERLENSYQNALNNTHINLLRNYYYDRYIIREEDISLDNLHNETKDEVIQNQKESLDKWLSFFVTKGSVYPTWAKYWAFQGMLKMGIFNSDLNGYNRRTKNNTNPFIECNLDVLSETIELIINYNSNKKIDTDIPEYILKTGSFSKIYGTLLIKYNELKKRKYNSIEGIWIKYNQGSEEDAKRLYGSLQGYLTDWCTAWTYTMSKRQLCGPYDDAINGGDFYVYYTKDENDEFKVPRIAIRMKDKNIVGEIRGIAENKCLEAGLEDIVSNKINGINNIKLESKQDVLYKCGELKKLSIIVKKTQNNEKLTKEEIKFIYRDDIVGFGEKQDKRIDEIIISRCKNRKIIYDMIILGIGNNIHIIVKYLKYIPDDIKDREFCKWIISHDGLSLKHIPEKYKSDKELVLIAVRQEGISLKYVSKKLRMDSEVVIEALKNNIEALKYVPVFITDRNFYLELVKINGKYIYLVPKKYRDKQIYLTSGIYALEYLPNNEEESKYIALEILSNVHYSYLRLLSPNIIGYREIVLSLLDKNKEVLQYVPEELRDSFDIKKYVYTKKD